MRELIQELGGKNVMWERYTVETETVPAACEEKLVVAELSAGNE